MKTTKLKVKKVTLLNLDESKLDESKLEAMAGGATTPVSCVCTKVGPTCRLVSACICP